MTHQLVRAFRLNGSNPFQVFASDFFNTLQGVFPLQHTLHAQAINRLVSTKSSGQFVVSVTYPKRTRNNKNGRVIPMRLQEKQVTSLVFIAGICYFWNYSG